MRRGLLLPIVAIVAACGSAAGSVTPPNPTPSPKGFDLSVWNLSITGSGPVATEANGGVDLFFPANGQADPRQLLGISLAGKCQLTGDFDLQADYSLVSWPARNGVRFGLVHGAYEVLRTSDPHSADNTYTTNFSGQLAGVVTPDTSGRIRLARVGATVTGYYFSNGTWVSLASASEAAGASDYSIAAWTDATTFGKHDVRVNVKHVTLSAPAAGCS